jgi:hypothetical protein
MKRERGGLAKPIANSLDVRTVGFGFATVATIILVLMLGIAPTALALGLLALLVID